MMESLPWDHFSSELWTAISQDRHPFACELEVVWNCNFMCNHCYLGPLRRQSFREMSTQQIKQILKEMAEAGVLWVQFTGGEPLLRSDIMEILAYTRHIGIVPILFTNGFLIDDNLCKDLERIQPHLVEITLYAFTEITHDRITNVSGALDVVLRNIDRIRRHKIPLGLKTVVTHQNKHELILMKQFADERGLPFRFEAKITPCVAGTQHPFDLRLTAEEIVQMEEAVPGYREQLQKQHQNFREKKPAQFFTCAAGLTTFHIDAEGFLSPCGLYRHKRLSVLESSFNAAWDGIGFFRNEPIPTNSDCHNCEHIFDCSYCPGWSYLECGSESACIPFKKGLVQERIKRGWFAPGSRLLS